MRRPLAVVAVVAVTAPVQAQPAPDAVFRAEAAFSSRDAAPNSHSGEGVVIERVCFNVGAYVIGVQRLPGPPPGDSQPGAIVYEEYQGSIAVGMVTVASPAEGEPWAWRVLEVNPEAGRVGVAQGC